LLESELFGYERGAFTGAVQSRAGKIEFADKGTLFLDEIEAMTPPMQVKLLRVLQEREVERLGGNRRAKIDMRVIAAANVDLTLCLARGTLREDFYYRINVIPIQLPPLRDRLEDLPLLIDHFLSRHPVAKEKDIKQLGPQVLDAGLQLAWKHTRTREYFGARYSQVSRGSDRRRGFAGRASTSRGFVPCKERR
jgi:transcriptional regulator with PAS, ATPase and Fis domain